MKEKLISVLTPTYNRAEKLKSLWESLKSQTSDDFVWVIIDDGSADNTQALVKEWKDSDILDVEYYYKPNGGKQTALNYAHSVLRTKIVFVVDSDDTLTSDAIETIKAYDAKYCNHNICGFGFLRADSRGLINGSRYRADESVKSYYQCRIQEAVKGDKAEVFYTEFFKKVRFPEYAGEKYYPEDGVWLRISQYADMVFSNRVIYITEYLDSGITKQSNQRRLLACPRGFADRYKLLLQYQCGKKEFIKRLGFYYYYSHYGSGGGYSELYDSVRTYGVKILDHLAGIAVSALIRHYMNYLDRKKSAKK